MADGVMSTNDDASTCKRYAVHVGYWRDDYIEQFVRSLPERKTPEINRGYYIRVHAVRELAKKFVTSTDRNCQIVNMGAGFDTLYWHLHDNAMSPTRGFYELDMKPVTERKCRAIKTKPKLHEVLGADLKIEDGECRSSHYKLLHCDLCKASQVEDKLRTAGVDPTVPTLFLAECVFAYMPPDATESLLRYVASGYTTAMVIDYDPIGLTDRFGEVMLANLRVRQCSLIGACADAHSKQASYTRSGFDHVTYRSMMEVYEALSSEERGRVERLEFLDEVDLLFDLLRHYCLCCAWVDKTSTFTWCG